MEPNLERKGVHLKNAGEFLSQDDRPQDGAPADNQTKTGAKKDKSKEQIKKSLKVDKEIKVTTTIVKGGSAKSSIDKRKASAPKATKSAPVKKSKGKIVIKPSSKKTDKKPPA